MAKRLAFTILMTVFGTSTLLAACSDDDDRPDGMTGGEGGDDGSKAGGPSVGGTSAGKGGTSAGTAGKGGSVTVGGEGGQSIGQGGAAGDTGMAGEGGDTTVGGAGGADGGADGMGGAGGAGGAGEPPVTYACGTATLIHRLCSAYTAAACDTLPDCTGGEPEGTCCTDCVTPSCPDCVLQTTDERGAFADCPACLAEVDRYLLCGVEPYDAGNLSEAVSCLDMGGPIVHFDCDPIFNSAVQCQGYSVANGCPANWPL